MDIYLLKNIVLILVLKFIILACSGGVVCHDGSRILSKFQLFVPYNLSNPLNLKSDRSFNELNILNGDDSYRKRINRVLRGLNFISGHTLLRNSLPNRTPSYNFTYDDHKIRSRDGSISNYRNSPFSDGYSDRSGATALFMSRKVTYGYRYNPERVKRKGTVRSRIYFDMWKDKDPYYVIHKFLYENDPDNKNFNYDIDLARKVKCKRNIFAHYKKDNRLRFFWYASRKNTAKGPVSRYINYALDRNEFRFSRLHSFFHLLPYVHEHYRDDPRYIYFMNRFLSRHGRVAAFKRQHSGSSSAEGASATTSTTGADDASALDATNSNSLGATASEPGTDDATATTTAIGSGHPDQPPRYRRTISWKDMLRQARREEEELFRRVSTEPVRVDLGNGRSFTVKPDGFKVFGEFYSKIDKKSRKAPYDVYSPFGRTQHSSKRRRFRQRIPSDPSLRCKTRRERILRNAKSRDISQFVRKYLKQKSKST